MVGLTQGAFLFLRLQHKEFEQSENLSAAGSEALALGCTTLSLASRGLQPSLLSWHDDVSQLPYKIPFIYLHIYLTTLYKAD